MNIFIDPEALTLQSTGLRVYSERLLSALTRKYPEAHFFSHAATINPAIFYNFSKRVKENTGVDVTFTYRLIPSFISWLHDFKKNRISDQFDIMHITANKIPLSCPFIDFNKLVLTVHDVYYCHEEKLSSEKALILKKQIEAAHTAQKIITVSEFSKKEIIKYLDIDPDKIYVTPIAVQWDRALLGMTAETAVKKDFFLSVGAIRNNKNYPTLLQAFRQYRKQNKSEKLVIVGCCQDRELLHEILNTEGVIYYPEVSAEKLIELYQTAKGFFALSTLEGFGIPLLEAMTCGCPACYARGNSMDEIGRTAAFSIEDPYDWKGASEIMERFSDSGTEVLNSVAECRKIAKEYSWERCAEQTYHVYELVKENVLEKQ